MATIPDDVRSRILDMALAPIDIQDSQIVCCLIHEFPC